MRDHTAVWSVVRAGIRAGDDSGRSEEVLRGNTAVWSVVRAGIRAGDGSGRS